MMFFRHKWHLAKFFFAVFGISWVEASGFYPAFAGVEIIRSSERQFVFRYHPTIVEKHVMTDQGKTQTILTLPGGQKEVLQKGLLLPCKRFLVGIPPNGNVSLRVVRSQFSLKKDVFVEKGKLPKDGNEHLQEKNFGPIPVRPETYTSRVFYPASIAQVTEVGHLRNLKIAQITIYPIQYKFSTHTARICSSVQISMQFSSHTVSDRKRNPVSTPFRQIARSLLLNGKQAQNWGEKQMVFSKTKRTDSYRYWFKIPIFREGMYKIGYADLKKTGLDSSQISADQLHIFYGGGRELPWDVNAPEPKLQEVATYFKDANHDGHFGKQDELIFYGQSVNGWAFSIMDKRFRHYINHYARWNVYWLAIGGDSRKQMARITEIPAQAETTRTAWRYFYKEVEKLNPEKSGIQWYWDEFSGNETRKYPLLLSGVSASDSFAYRIHLIGASFNHHNLKIALNGEPLADIDLPYERSLVVSGGRASGLKNGGNMLSIQQKSTLGRKDKCLLDWVELNYRSTLRADSTGLVFYAPLRNKDVTFALSGFHADSVTIFDVSDPFNVRYSEAKKNSQNPGEWLFSDHLSLINQKKYFAVALDQMISVKEVYRAASPVSGLRDVQNRADYLIIAHESLLGADLSRLASHRADPAFWPGGKDAPVVKIVPVNQIYNAFSWGIPDPTAIRNFLKYTFSHWTKAPSYVLLVGNACYDMKQNSSASPPTLVPTHEDELRVTDDWFAFLNNDRIMDMLIGRLSVQNQEDLHNVVEKIIEYDTQLPPAPWQGRVLLVADDANSPTYKSEDIAFGRDTESLSRDSVFSDLSIEKVYLDAYSQDASGRKEEAKRDFLAQLNKGTVFVNFLGHANLEVLTHENIFYTPQDLPLVQNGRRYPLFFAGTCAVGQFDYDRKPCMAEYLTNLPERGMIAAIASTRWTWHKLNYGVNKSFVKTLFDPKNRGRLSIGEALLAAKLTSRYADHRELITLFGDPALRLALPTRNVGLRVLPDTLSLHKRTQIMASVSNSRIKPKNFNGEIFLELRDSGQIHHPAGYSYFLPGEIIFQDTLFSEDGTVQDDFFPKTITLSGGKLGRLYSFAWNRKLRAAGRLDSIPIKRDVIHSFSEIDSTGPEIEVSVNQKRIEDGAEITVFPHFRCRFKLRDTVSGILVTKPENFPVQFTVNGDTTLTRNLTSQLICTDSTRSNATAEIDCRNLPLGEQTFEITAWDQAYNPSHFEWKGMVVPSELKLTHVLTYPNPASERTYFTFDLSGSAQVTVKIYTLSGRLIQMFEAEAQPGFNRIPGEGWNCRDRDGDPLANGVYLYKIVARSEFSVFQTGAKKQYASALGRLAIFR